MPVRRLALALVAVAALVGPAGATSQSADAVTATTFVINGRGWGHGVGMPQWGAYGYAQHGLTYDKILAHFYPGTTLAPAPVARIKVLLVDSAKKLVVSSTDPFLVVDGEGIRHNLAGGEAARPVAFRPGCEPALARAPLARRPDRRLERQLAIGRQLGADRGVRARRRLERDAARLAARGGQGAGGGGALVRAVAPARCGLRRLRRHARPGLRRRRHRDADRRRGRRRDQAPGAALRREGRDDVLLLELGRPYRFGHRRLS